MTDKAKKTWFLFGVYMAMLAGMAAKALVESLTSGGEMDVKQFILPLLISPIVYGVVFKIAKGSDETILMLIFGFQNGFFWQDIFGQFAPPVAGG